MRVGRLAAAASCVLATTLTLAAIPTHAATPQRYCGHISLPGGPGEADARGVKCSTATRVLRYRVRTGRSPVGWRCRTQGPNSAVYVQCSRHGVIRAVLYQPPSVYGE